MVVSGGVDSNLAGFPQLDGARKREDEVGIGVDAGSLVCREECLRHTVPGCYENVGKRETETDD
jgi:hypothetical protein